MQALYQQMVAIFCTYMVNVFGIGVVPTRSGWIKSKGLKSGLPMSPVDHDRNIIQFAEYKAFIAATVERVKAVIDEAETMTNGVMAAMEVRLNVKYDKPVEPVHKHFWQYAAIFLVNLDSKNVSVIPGIGTIRYFRNEGIGEWSISDHKGNIQKVDGMIVRFDTPLNALNALLKCRRSVPVVTKFPW